MTLMKCSDAYYFSILNSNPEFLGFFTRLLLTVLRKVLTSQRLVQSPSQPRQKTQRAQDLNWKSNYV